MEKIERKIDVFNDYMSFFKKIDEKIDAVLKKCNEREDQESTEVKKENSKAMDNDKLFNDDKSCNDDVLVCTISKK